MMGAHFGRPVGIVSKNCIRTENLPHKRHDSPALTLPAIAAIGFRDRGEIQSVHSKRLQHGEYIALHGLYHRRQ